jgi:hypothetical protein
MILLSWRVIMAQGGWPEHCKDYALRMRERFASLMVTQTFSLNLEQSGFHCRGPTQPPQKTSQSQYELALDR